MTTLSPIVFITTPQTKIMTSQILAEVDALPAAPTVRSAVNRLWSAYREEPLSALLTLYCQAAASGLIGEEPYRSDARATNELWAAALRDYLVRSGAPVRRVARIVTLVDSALYGFHLDLTTDRPEELAHRELPVGGEHPRVVACRLGLER